MTPTERDNQFVVFDAATASLVRVGVDVDKIYRENNTNIEPRLGLAWTLGGDGRTVLRAAYGSAVDQPGTTAVNGTAGNPPFATPLTATGAIPLSSAVSLTQPIGLAPTTVDPQFRNASLRSWNVNVQRQLAGDLAATVAYFGSRGEDLRISRNINQPVNGVRPFPALSASSPIRPGATLGTITQVESTGFSSYHALSLTATKRLSRGLQFDTSYTWSKSLDTNSLNSSNFNVQDGYDIPNQYGLSDFDARHRFVLSATYQLPFTGSAWTRGWQIATIVQSQSGNPVNIVTSNATLNGVPNTVRPDLVAPIRIIGSVDQWFDPASFAAVNRFGNLGRNVVIGPAFHNTDLSVSKVLTIASATACSSAPMPSICSTIRTSARPATSSAVRPSARSRARACRPARPARRARFNSWRSCRSDARPPSAPAAVSWPWPSSRASRRASRVCAGPIKHVLIIHGGPAAFPGSAAFDAALRKGCSRTRPSRLTRTPSTWRTRNSRRPRTRRCAITSASSSPIAAPTW